MMDWLREFNIWTILIRLFLAALLGGVIGLERGRQRRAAGLRTHILVCIGAALTAMVGFFARDILGIENYNKNIQLTGKTKCLIFHDYNLENIKDSDLIIKDILNQIPNKSKHFIPHLRTNIFYNIFNFGYANLKEKLCQ